MFAVRQYLTRLNLTRLIGLRGLMPTLASLLLSWAAGRPGVASDWPQVLGPNRDGVAIGETLHPKWGESGPKVIWELPVGNGFAGVAVAGEQAIVFVREGSEEIVRCCAVETGKVLWESGSPCTYEGGVSGDKGPRCVPLISENRVVVFGVQGVLRCLSLTDGKELWRRDTTADFRPLEGYFGVGSTPAIYKNRLIVNVGGREQSSIVAFDMADGKTVWNTFTDAASYSSPVIMRVDQADMAIVVTRLHVTGLNPDTGDLKFSIPFGARGPTVNGATPVIIGKQIFLSASYNIGSLLIGIENGAAKEIWRDEELLATQYATPVSGSTSGILFAMEGRQDAGRGSASLKCIDVSGKKVLWEESGLDYGSVIRVNDELLVLTCGGELIRVEASSEKYRELSRTRVLKATDSGYRLPALANGRLFIRDEATVRCLEVGPSKR